MWLVCGGRINKVILFSLAHLKKGKVDMGSVFIITHQVVCLSTAWEELCQVILVVVLKDDGV